MDKLKPKYKPTIILFENVIYQLKKVDKLNQCYSCELCDLVTECSENNLVSLCQPHGYSIEWYFRKSWDDADKTLRELVEAND